MKRFPSEFSALVGERAIREALRKGPAIAVNNGASARMAWFPKLLKSSVVGDGIRLLDRHLSPHLKELKRRIPRSTIDGMDRNYSETLPKTLLIRTVMLNGNHTAAARSAEGIGLRAMMRSNSLRQFAEVISGHRLEPDPGCQVICYRQGDYSGPHNDHHPEEPHLRRGYVDLHITMSNESVEHQWLVYENRGLFNGIVNVGIESGVAVSYLPFWHYTTPLVARRGRGPHASRWLLLVSFVLSRHMKGRETKA